MKYVARKHQIYGTKKMIELDATGPFIDMGLGKTVMALTAIIELKKQSKIKNTLVIAPKFVADNVWDEEIHKWDHTRHLKYSKILGSAKERTQALKRKADIYIVNVENIAWLVGMFGSNWPFDYVIIDESSKFKNHQSQRFKALKLVRRYIKRIVELTGTPAPQGFIDLWAQLYLLDKGERLYDSFNKYRSVYFESDKRNRSTIFSYKLKQGNYLLGEGWYEKEILDRIKDICFSMKTEDYIELPDRIDNVRKIIFPDKLQSRYEQFEKDQVMQFMSDVLQDGKVEISAINAASLTNKLLQFANGAIYDEDRNWHTIHDEKLNALEELYEELNSRHVLTFYSFVFDKHRIMKRFKDKAVDIKAPNAIKRWNNGEIDMLVGHPASAGHGLNLQFGGRDIFWYGSPWSLELWLQGLKRIHRQGVNGIVMNTQLAVANTIDMDVINALHFKDKRQNALINAVKARIEKYF